MFWLLGGLVVFLLGISVLRGAPYVPTHNSQIDIALDLLNLEEGDRLIDVGSGDGRVLIKAAERGLSGTGYEINPLLVIISRWRLRKHRQVKIIWGDMWSKTLPPDTKAVFVFTMGRYMYKLATKVRSEIEGDVQLVSHGFELKGVEPLKKKEAVFLYKI